ncbi:hypothetical protein L7F22_041280 [Adiantum nelumboides]|nr:hypothetical protein [Adiantum nelumboides]
MLLRMMASNALTFSANCITSWNMLVLIRSKCCDAEQMREKRPGPEGASGLLDRVWMEDGVGNVDPACRLVYELHAGMPYCGACKTASGVVNAVGSKTNGL